MGGFSHDWIENINSIKNREVSFMFCIIIKFKESVNRVAGGKGSQNLQNICCGDLLINEHFKVDGAMFASSI